PAVGLHQLPDVDVGVPLGGGQTGVSEKLLDRAKVRTCLEEVCGKRVTQRMWADAVAGAARGNITPDKLVDAAGRQPASLIVEEHRVAGPPAPGEDTAARGRR